MTTRTTRKTAAKKTTSKPAPKNASAAKAVEAFADAAATLPPEPRKKTPHGEATAPATHVAYQLSDDGAHLAEVMPFGIRKADLDASKDHALANDGWKVVTVPSGVGVLEHLRDLGRL